MLPKLVGEISETNGGKIQKSLNFNYSRMNEVQLKIEVCTYLLVQKKIELAQFLTYITLTNIIISFSKSPTQIAN